MKRLAQSGVALASVAWAALASAHPALVGSRPSSGQVVEAAPKELRMRFSEPIEAAFTHVEVLDAAGLQVKGRALPAVNDDPDAIAIALPPLGARVYKARWSAAGRDGHRVKGEFTFTVK